MADEGPTAVEPPPFSQSPAPEQQEPIPDAGPGIADGTTSPPMDAIQMLCKVRQADGVHYRLPVTPDDFLIPGNLTPGTEIYIFGLLSPTMEKVEFQVREGKTRERVSLSVLATSTPEAKITVRTYQNKTHTVDSSAEAELSPSEAIVIRVKAYANGVARVTINEKVLTFTQKADLPLDKCAYFSIFGDVFTAAISLFKPHWPDHFHVTLGNTIAAGYHFTIEGTVAPEAEKIAFNVLRSPDVHDDVLVGLSCQFTGEKQMVRRTKQEGVWLDEQLEHEVPFEQGAPFVFDVAIGEKEFNMTVNGKPLPPYNHKVFYGTGQYICVDKNVVLKNIRVCSISHPKHWTNKPPNVKQANLIFHNSDTPTTRPIRVDVGQCYYVQGTPIPHSKTFKIVFAKGDAADSDALLVVEAMVPERKVFVYDGDAGNKGEGTPADIKIGRLFSCRIDVLPENYKLWVNTLASDANADAYIVKHRLPISDVGYLNVFGQIKQLSALKAVEEFTSPA